MTSFKLFYKKAGNHTHVRVFSAKSQRFTHGKNGDLCFGGDEWEDFLRCFSDQGQNTILILPEEGKQDGV